MYSAAPAALAKPNTTAAAITAKRIASSLVPGLRRTAGMLALPRRKFAPTAWGRSGKKRRIRRDCAMTPAAFDLFTIGHSNHPIERFLELARGAGITAIADVRSTPASRRYPWFTQARLEPRLAAQGGAYVPLGEALGGRPRDSRLYRDDGVADYLAMARTDEFRAGLGRAVEGRSEET